MAGVVEVQEGAHLALLTFSFDLLDAVVRDFDLAVVASVIILVLIVALVVWLCVITRLVISTILGLVRLNTSVIAMVAVVLTVIRLVNVAIIRRLRTMIDGKHGLLTLFARVALGASETPSNDLVVARWTLEIALLVTYLSIAVVATAIDQQVVIRAGNKLFGLAKFGAFEPLGAAVALIILKELAVVAGGYFRLDRHLCLDSVSLNDDKVVSDFDEGRDDEL